MKKPSKNWILILCMKSRYNENNLSIYFISLVEVSNLKYDKVCYNDRLLFNCFD